MGPAELEAVARKLAATYGAAVATVEGDALLAGYPQIHAVGRAAGSYLKHDRMRSSTSGESA